MRVMKISKPKKERMRHYIGAWREYRGLTQQQLADRIEMSRENLSKIEAMKVPYRQDFLEYCSQALNVSKGDLIERDPAVQIKVDALRELLDGLS